jgi:hypothetical protein
VEFREFEQGEPEKIQNVQNNRELNLYRVLELAQSDIKPSESAGSTESEGGTTENPVSQDLPPEAQENDSIETAAESKGLEGPPHINNAPEPGEDAQPIASLTTSDIDSNGPPKIEHASEPGNAPAAKPSEQPTDTTLTESPTPPVEPDSSSLSTDKAQPHTWRERLNQVRDKMSDGLEASLAGMEKTAENTNAVAGNLISFLNPFRKKVEEDPGVDPTTQEATDSALEKFSSLDQALEAELQQKHPGIRGKLDAFLGNQNITREAIGIGLSATSIITTLAGLGDISTLARVGRQVVGAWSYGNLSAKLWNNAEMGKEAPAVLTRSKELLNKPKEDLTQEEVKELQELITKQLVYYKKGVDLTRYEVQDSPSTDKPKNWMQKAVEQIVTVAKSPETIKGAGLTAYCYASPVLASMISPVLGTAVLAANTALFTGSRVKHIIDLQNEAKEQKQSPKEMHETLKGLIGRYQETHGLKEEHLAATAKQINEAATAQIRSKAKMGLLRGLPGAAVAAISYGIIDAKTAHADTVHAASTHSTSYEAASHTTSSPEFTSGHTEPASHMPTEPEFHPERLHETGATVSPSIPDTTHTMTNDPLSVGEYHPERLHDTGTQVEPSSPHLQGPTEHHGASVETNTQEPEAIPFKSEASKDIIEASVDKQHPHGFNHEFTYHGEQRINVDLNNDEKLEAGETFKVEHEGGKRFVLIDWADVHGEDGTLDKLQDHVLKVEVEGTGDINIADKYGIMVDKNDHSKFFAGLDDKGKAVYTEKDNALVYRFQNKLSVVKEQIRDLSEATGKNFDEQWQEFKSKLGSKMNREDWKFTTARSGAMASIDNDRFLTPEIQVHQWQDHLTANMHNTTLNYSPEEAPYSPEAILKTAKGDESLAKAIEHSAFAYPDYSLQLDSVSVDGANRDDISHLLDRLSSSSSALAQRIEHLSPSERDAVIDKLASQVHDNTINQEELFSTLKLETFRDKLVPISTLTDSTPRLNKFTIETPINDAISDPKYAASPWKVALVNLKENLTHRYGDISEIFLSPTPKDNTKDVITFKFNDGTYKQFIAPPGQFEHDKMRFKQ